MMAQASRSQNSNPQSLDRYFQEINRIPLLSNEEEREVVAKVKAGDERALEQLVQSNLRFVVSIARRYANKGVPLEDLISEGNLGLLRAAERYDADRGYKFISYAVWWIKQAILNSLSQNSRIVRLPANKVALLQKIARAKRELTHELGVEPTEEQIALRLDVTVDQVITATSSSVTHVSLDELVSDESEARPWRERLIDERAESPEESAELKLLSESMRRAMQDLTEREQIVLTLYFGLGNNEPLTLQVIGERLGLTRERIRQVKERAIEKLRDSSLVGQHA